MRVGDGPTVKVSHAENVYSYFLFAIPLEDKKKAGAFSCNRILAYILVLFTLLLQSILLFTIFEKVVNGDAEWRRTILDPRGESFIGSAWNPYHTEEEQCNDGASLCLKENGTYSCAPPSVQLTGRWEELDINGDGVWRRSEAKMAQNALQCKYSVNVVEVFDVFIKFLKSRDKIIWLHPDIENGRAIHKAYFSYAVGDIIMCGYRNTDMCANLLKRGIFDAPLKYGTAPRVGQTIDSALEYCYALLEDGGVCDRTLPSTYTVWKKGSMEQCKSPNYDKYVFRNPANGKTKSMLVVSYDAVQAYHRAGSLNLFVVFKTIIIGIYLLAMLGEGKAIFSIVALLRVFPKFPSEDEDEEKTEELFCYATFQGTTKRIYYEECSYEEFLSIVRESFDIPGQQELHISSSDKVLWDPAPNDLVVVEKGEPPEEGIEGITDVHRYTMVVLTIIRLFMLFILCWVGCMFLLKDTDYIDLLLNALGLIVVVEITENVYMYLLSSELREEVEDIGQMTVQTQGTSTSKNPAKWDLLILLAFILTTVGIIIFNHYMIVAPLTDSLECACLSSGPRCAEAHRFSNEFWDRYWTQDVPASLKKMDQLKATALFEHLSPDFDADMAVVLGQQLAAPSPDLPKIDPDIDVRDAPVVEGPEAHEQREHQHSARAKRLLLSDRRESRPHHRRHHQKQQLAAEEG